MLKIDQKDGMVFFPVELEVESMFDWKKELEGDLQKGQSGRLVTVNNKEIALFKYGDIILGEFYF